MALPNDLTDALSVLRLLSASPTGTNVTVTWQSVTGGTYFPERSTNLSASPPFTLVAPNLTGQTNTASFTDTNAASMSPLFYRIGVGTEDRVILIRSAGFEKYQ